MRFKLPTSCWCCSFALFMYLADFALPRFANSDRYFLNFPRNVFLCSELR